MENDVEIVLVEDNSDDEELALLAFKKNNIGNKVHVARDGAEALEYLFGSIDGSDYKSHHPKVILLDLKLPKINGIEVLKKLKSHPEAKNTPVVILTSSAEERDLVESYNLGVNSYIRKPVDFNQFTEAVGQIGLYWLLLNKQPEAVTIEQ